MFMFVCCLSVCMYACLHACSHYVYLGIYTEPLMNFPEIDVVLLIPSYKLSGYDSLAQYS